MNRKTILLILLGILFAWMPRQAAAADFTLFYCGSVGGELEPCG